MAGILRSCGSEVFAVPSVSAAVSQLRTRGESIDAMVLDLMLPDGEGSEVLRELRALKLATRVCVVTAVSDPLMLTRVQGYRPDCVLRKPIDVNDLLRGLNLKGAIG